jgi:hypothetical protein
MSSSFLPPEGVVIEGVIEGDEEEDEDEDEEEDGTMGVGDCEDGRALLSDMNGLNVTWGWNVNVEEGLRCV